MHILKVFFYNVLPVFMVVGLGALFQRAFKPNIRMMSKLGFYFLLPGFVFVLIYEHPFRMESGKMFLAAMLLMFLFIAFSWGICKICGSSRSFTAAFMNSTVFFNAGNMGFPLMTLIFTGAPYVTPEGVPLLNVALGIYVSLWLSQTIGVNLVAFIIAGSAERSFKEGVLHVLRLPAMYAIFLAFGLRMIKVDVGATPFWPALVTLKNGYIVIVLMTLGGQLARTTWSFRNMPVYYASLFRLLFSPLLALGLVFLMGFSGLSAQLLCVAAALPSAAMSALIAVEYDLCPDFAASTVMSTTLLSAFTLPVVVVLAQMVFPVI